jgi:hypothetical protein
MLVGWVLDVVDLRLVGIDGAAVIGNIAVGAYESGSMLGRYCC